MDDILFSVAWQCGDKDCAQQWHKSAYWIYPGKKRATYSVDNYSDGDHETIGARDLPATAEITKSWVAYSRFVLETGTDPLAEFFVKYETKTRERWEFKFSKSIVGPMLQQARRRGKQYTAPNLPSHVREYLNLRKSGAPTLQDFKTAAEFEAAGLHFNVWQAHSIDNKRPRDQAAIAKDLRRLARKHLKREFSK